MVALLEEWSELDIGVMVNNAGRADFGDFVNWNPTEILKDICLDFESIRHVNTALVPRMRRRESRSAILNVSSATGVLPSPRLGVYSSMKFCLNVYS